MFDTRFPKPFTEMIDSDEEEEWFDLVHGKRVGQKKAGNQSAFDEMWDWSVPMFKNKPFRHASTTPRKSMHLFLFSSNVLLVTVNSVHFSRVTCIDNVGRCMIHVWQEFDSCVVSGLFAVL